MKRISPETSLLLAVLDYARLRGWITLHQRPARTRRGWRTAIQGDPGFPDFVAIRNGRLVIAELKSDTGKTTSDQRVWLSAFRDVPGVETYLWRPASWNEIVEVLL